jgi:hypothetical protein
MLIFSPTAAEGIFLTYTKIYQSFQQGKIIQFSANHTGIFIADFCNNPFARFRVKGICLHHTYLIGI